MDFLKSDEARSKRLENADTSIRCRGLISVIDDWRIPRSQSHFFWSPQTQTRSQRESEKLCLYCFSRGLQKHGDTMRWFLLKLFLFIASIMTIIMIIIFIIIMIMMAMSCSYFLRSRQTPRDPVTTRELKTIACPLQTNTFDTRSISVCLFNFTPTWGPLTWPEFFSNWVIAFVYPRHCVSISNTFSSYVGEYQNTIYQVIVCPFRHFFQQLELKSLLKWDSCKVH